MSDRAAKARSVQQANAAHRAVNDPVALARAARIIRTALVLKRITLAELSADVPVPGGAA